MMEENGRTDATVAPMASTAVILKSKKKEEGSNVLY